MKIPNYLESINKEFIGIDGELYRIKVELIHFNEFSKTTRLELESQLETDTIAQISLDQLGIMEENERLKKFGLCNYGGFDDKADITKEDNTTEYYDCGERGGRCPVEGKLCKHVQAKNGCLTPREIDVIKLIASDLPDKQIADRLNISISTANQHRVNIQHKIGSDSKVGTCRFAIEKRII